VDVVEIARITADELLHDPAGVLERVAAGEKVAVVKDGVLIAVISPPDLTKAMTEGMVKAGILDSDWRIKQAELKRWILTNPPMPAEPHRQSLSETLIQMREEENR
jgi:antitoxin (DNA-binding transcriptional repressor) of toxin-antitoxin stability system